VKQTRTIPLADALIAQKALRDAAGLGTEKFALTEFVGMISDEVEQLRRMGRSDAEIAELLRGAAGIDISAADIEANYVGPEHRHPPERD
jgi:hypothetical protein